MFNRIKQVILFLNLRKSNNSDKEAENYLNEEEKKLFDAMAEYDKRHSLNVLADVERLQIGEEEKSILRKMALLHDIGKESDTTFFERIYHAMTKRGKRLRDHPYKGYEKLKEIDREVAELVKIHHSKVDNKLVKIFQRIDDNN
jgi:putative nucleotidyltransferase with HDIG domain